MDLTLTIFNQIWYFCLLNTFSIQTLFSLCLRSMSKSLGYCISELIDSKTQWELLYFTKSPAGLSDNHAEFWTRLQALSILENEKVKQIKSHPGIFFCFNCIFRTEKETPCVPWLTVHCDINMSHFCFTVQCGDQPFYPTVAICG